MSKASREKERRQKKVPPALGIGGIVERSMVVAQRSVKDTLQKMAAVVPAVQQVSLDLDCKALVEIALNCWRLKRKMEDPERPGESLEGMSILYRHVESIQKSLDSLGVEMKDYTGETFGSIQKAIAFEPTQGARKETILKTIRPTIFYKGQLLDRGEVIVGTPITEQQSQVEKPV